VSVQPSYDGALRMSARVELTNHFDGLFNEYYARLARLLYRVTGDRGRAEEVAAEAFWRLYRNPPPARINLEGWLYRTGVRLALDQLKKDRRRARYEALAAMLGFVRSPEQVLETNQESGRVRRALAVLKPEQAALILLRGEGLSYAEVAAALNLNPNSVGTMLARAEEAFRKEYVNSHAQR